MSYRSSHVSRNKQCIAIRGNDIFVIIRICAGIIKIKDSLLNLITKMQRKI